MLNRNGARKRETLYLDGQATYLEEVVCLFFFNSWKFWKMSVWVDPEHVCFKFLKLPANQKKSIHFQVIVSLHLIFQYAPFMFIASGLKRLYFYPEYTLD